LQSRGHGTLSHLLGVVAGNRWEERLNGEGSSIPSSPSFTGVRSGVLGEPSIVVGSKLKLATNLKPMPRILIIWTENNPIIQMFTFVED
jgi:hypothetical protein